MDQVIARIMGTGKAEYDRARAIELVGGMVVVIWLDSEIIVKFENRDAFKAWIGNNSYIASVHFV